MIVLPRAEIDKVVSLLYQLPGINTSDDRRTILNLIFQREKNGDAIPESAIEDGWISVVESLAQPPALVAIERIIDLLMGVQHVMSVGGLAAELTTMIERLHQLSKTRSFPIFLARLGLNPSSVSGVALLDKVFVPPKQYERALEIIESTHVLFLFGDPHMGKTFSALHLLWQYFRDEFREPYWWRSLTTTITNTLDFNLFLEEGAVIYIEDPFGRTAPLDDTNTIFRILRRLIEEAKARDVRVVITSRTVVLRAAIADRLQDYVVTLSQELVLEKAYDDDSLTLIATNYVKKYQPVWRNNRRRYSGFY